MELYISTDLWLVYVFTFQAIILVFYGEVDEYKYEYIYYTDIDRDGHVPVDCPESCTFPRDCIFPKCAALRGNIVPRENITILAPPTRDISTVPVDICYINWSK